MKKYLSILLIFTIILTMGLFTTACSKDDEDANANSNSSLDLDAEDSEDDADPDLKENPSKGISYDEENDEAVIKRTKSDSTRYFGSWTALSDKAEYLYGNIDIKINEDGTWSGDITGEKLKGKWTNKGDHLHMQNELFSFDLTFDTSGNLVMIETGSDGVINTVLVRK